MRSKDGARNPWSAPTTELWAPTVSRICAGLDEMVEAFRGRRLDHVEFPYVYLDATYLKVRNSVSQVASMAMVVATGVTADGNREVLGCDIGDSESEGFWQHFLGSLRARGLTGVRLVIADAHAGLGAAADRIIQGAGRQRCRVHPAAASRDAHRGTASAARAARGPLHGGARRDPKSLLELHDQLRRGDLLGPTHPRR